MKRKYKRKSGFATLPHINKAEVENISRILGRKTTEEEARLFIRNRISPDYAALIDAVDKEMARVVSEQEAFILRLIEKRFGSPTEKKQRKKRKYRMSHRRKP